MNNNTEFMLLDEAADLLKMSVNSILNQAHEGRLHLYWRLNRTLYSENMELQPVGTFPTYPEQSEEEWETNLTPVHVSQHFNFIPLQREHAGELLNQDSTVCWLTEVSTDDDTFYLPETTSFTITRQHLAVLRRDAEEWANPTELAEPVEAVVVEGQEVEGGETVIDDNHWITKARKIADRIGLEWHRSGIGQITARNICEAVATELEKDNSTHGLQGPRRPTNVRQEGLRGWKFKRPSGTKTVD